MAGYEQQQYTVVGEFMGDLPFHYASQSAAAGVGNADACLIYIRAPPLYAQLSRLPRSFLIGDEKVHISLPGQRGTSSIATAPASAAAAAAVSEAVTYREGPRHIRIRQRGERAARRSAAAPSSAAPRPAAQPQQSLSQSAAPSSALQNIEAAVAGSRHGSGDRRGLGSSSSPRSPAPHTPDFVAATSTAQPQDMDCIPPVAATVLPPRGQLADMDVDTSQPADHAAAQTSPPATAVAPQPMQIDPLMVGEDVRDELMEWMLTHTALTQQGMRAAIARVHAEMPHLLVSQPTPAAVYDALNAIDTAERQLQPARSRSPQRSSPTVPPGFELQAAQRAAAAALAGPVALRRSGRASKPPTQYWISQHTGRTAASRRPSRP